MHEMSYIIRLVNLAAKTAEEQNAKRVEKIVVKAGKMMALSLIICKNTIRLQYAALSLTARR